MSEIRTGTLLLVAGSLIPQAHERACKLARTLGARLKQAVDFCTVEAGGEPLAAGIRALVASGVQRLVMSLFPGCILSVICQ